MFVSDVIKTGVWWPIAANQKKKKKMQKYKNTKTWKIFYSEKKSPKLSWLKKNKKMKIKKNEKIKKNIQKKTPQNYHDPWVPNLILFLDRF